MKQFDIEATALTTQFTPTREPCRFLGGSIKFILAGKLGANWLAGG